MELKQAFIEGLHDIRLLGNDAAHVEAESYNHVDKEEVGTAIEVVKEILKSVYQMDNIVLKMAKLKKSSTDSSP